MVKQGRSRTGRRGALAVLAAFAIVAGACSPGDGETESGEGDTEAANRPEFDVVDTSDAADAEEAAQMWIDEGFQESTLTPEQQLEEMQWFIEAAQPYEGMEIIVVSETSTTHES